jgi:hypothetical protein
LAPEQAARVAQIAKPEARKMHPSAAHAVTARCFLRRSRAQEG